MKRNYKRARREGALQRLEINRASMPKRILDEKDKKQRGLLQKDMNRMDSEIATLVSRIGYG